jgi:hypothetical protein
MSSDAPSTLTLNSNEDLGDSFRGDITTPLAPGMSSDALTTRTLTPNEDLGDPLRGDSIST